MRFFLGYRKVITKADVQRQLAAYLEIILNIPGVVGEEELDVTAVIEIASARQAEQEGGISGAVARADSRISCRRRRETDLTLAIVTINAAVPSFDVLKTEFHAVLALNPPHLFVDVNGFASGIRVHVRAVGNELGVISGHFSRLGAKRRTRNLDCLAVIVIHSINVARILNDETLVKAYCEMVEQVWLNNVVVVYAIVSRSDVVAPIRARNPDHRPEFS